MESFSLSTLSLPTPQKSATVAAGLTRVTALRRVTAMSSSKTTLICILYRSSALAGCWVREKGGLGRRFFATLASKAGK
jgi:hypothetical protein